eukprot:3436152-Pleurochrysis_carterae.AAC.4
MEIQPVIDMTACKRVPDRCDTIATTLAAVRGNPYEDGGSCASSRGGRWKYVRLWSDYDTPTLETKHKFIGVIRITTVYSKWPKRAIAKKCVALLITLVSAALECVPPQLKSPINLSSHQVERDRPSKRRPPTTSVIVTVNSKKRIVRRALHPENRHLELVVL